MSDQFSTVSDLEASKHNQNREEVATAPLTTTAIIYGVVAGVLMSLFLSVSGYFVTGDNVGFGFLKFLILGAALYPLLLKTKAQTPAGKSVKNAIATGAIASVSAGVVSAIAVILFNGKSALPDGVDGATEAAGNQFVLAGVSFITCLVAGMIFTLIFMQFLKDAKPAS